MLTNDAVVTGEFPYLSLLISVMRIIVFLLDPKIVCVFKNNFLGSYCLG